MSEETAKAAEDVPGRTGSAEAVHASPLHDTDADEIVALLAGLGTAEEERPPGLAVEVAFGDIGDLIISGEEADVEVALPGWADEPVADAGPAPGAATTPVAEDAKDTASTEIAHGLENASGPAGALPIKIIFDDDGSGHAL